MNFTLMDPQMAEAVGASPPPMAYQPPPGDYGFMSPEMSAWTESTPDVVTVPKMGPAPTPSPEQESTGPGPGDRFARMMRMSSSQLFDALMRKKKASNFSIVGGQINPNRVPYNPQIMQTILDMWNL